MVGEDLMEEGSFVMKDDIIGKRERRRKIYFV